MERATIANEGYIRRGRSGRKGTLCSWPEIVFDVSGKTDPGVVGGGRRGNLYTLPIIRNY